MMRTAGSLRPSAVIFSATQDLDALAPLAVGERERLKPAAFLRVVHLEQTIGDDATEPVVMEANRRRRTRSRARRSASRRAAGPTS